jgi:hypothetical protein
LVNIIKKQQENSFPVPFAIAGRDTIISIIAFKNSIEERYTDTGCEDKVLIAKTEKLANLTIFIN